MSFDTECINQFTIRRRPFGGFVVIVLAGRVVRGVVQDVRGGLMLRLVLADVGNAYLAKGAEVQLVTDAHEGIYTVTKSIRCPGGELVAWVWLARTGPLPKHHPPTDEVRAMVAKPRA
jgi:hypothetical protein